MPAAEDADRSPRFCGRWSLGCRDVAGMPAGSAPVAEWAAWYRTCGCELCTGVAQELEDRPAENAVPSW